MFKTLPYDPVKDLAPISMLFSGTNYLLVFRMVGATAFMAYGVGQIVNSVWKGQPWSMTIKDLFDGLIYSLLTAGTFGWLWPH